MFIAVEVEKKAENNIVKSVMRIIKPPKATLATKTLWDVRYLVATIPYRRKGINFDMLYEIVKPYHESLILPKDVILSPESGLCRYDPLGYKIDIATSAAVDVLNLSHIQLYQRSVGIIDPEGEALDVASSMIMYCTQLRVLTKSPERYEELVQQMLDLYGAPLILCDKLSSLNSCVLIVCPLSYSDDSDIIINCPIITSEEVKLKYRAQIVNRIEPQIPDDILCELPYGIDPVDFFAAVYEGAPPKKLGKPHALSAYCGTRYLKLYEIAQYIAKRQASS